MATFCSPEELAALGRAFGGEEAATAFCDKLGGTASGLYQDQLDGLREGLNTFFLTVNGALVFVMHAGFAMVGGCYPPPHAPGPQSGCSTLHLTMN